MKVYFYSKIKALLKINGIFVGKISKTPTVLDFFEPLKDSFIEFLPLLEEYFPITSQGFSSKQLKVFNLKNSVLVCPNFSKKRNAPYKIATQKFVEIFNTKHLLTVASDSCYKFYLNGDFYVTDEIPFLTTDCLIEQSGDLVFISFNLKKKCLFVYNLQNDKLNLCYKDIVDDYSYSSYSLNVYKKHTTPIDVEITETWTYNKSFTLTNTSSNYDKSILMTSEKIKGLIFLNLLILNADVSPFLSSNLLKKVNVIKEFLSYPYLCFENFESGYDNEYLILTNEGAKCVYLTFKNGLIEDFMVDDY